MIRFVDLGKQLGPGEGVDEAHPRQFAFYDTIIDRFLDMGGDQVFESWEDLATAIKSSPMSPKWKVELYQRLWSLCPDWVKGDQKGVL